MLHAGTDLLHLVLQEVLWIDEFRPVLVVLLSCAEHIVVAHAPSIQLVALVRQCVAVVATSAHGGDLFIVERLYSVRDCKVVDACQVGLLLFFRRFLALAAFLGAAGLLSRLGFVSSC